MNESEGSAVKRYSASAGFFPGIADDMDDSFWDRRKKMKGGNRRPFRVLGKRFGSFEVVDKKHGRKFMDDED